MDFYKIDYFRNGQFLTGPNVELIQCTFVKQELLLPRPKVTVIHDSYFEHSSHLYTLSSQKNVFNAKIVC